MQQQQDNVDHEIEKHTYALHLSFIRWTVQSQTTMLSLSLSQSRFDRVDLDAIKAPSLIDMLLVHLSLSLSLSLVFQRPPPPRPIDSMNDCTCLASHR